MNGGGGTSRTRARALRTANLPALLVASLPLMACGAGSAKLLGTPVHRPIALVFRSKPEVAATADRRAMQAFARALLDGLKEKGLTAYLVDPGAAAPPPRLELMIERWDELGGRRLGTSTLGPAVGATALVDAPLAALGGAAIGTGNLLHARDVQVECAVFREGDATPADRYVFVNDSGNSVASEIMTRGFTDKTKVDRPVVRGGHGGS